MIFLDHADCCSVDYCRSPVDLIWLEKPLCERHWHEVCELREQGVSSDEILKNGKQAIADAESRA